MTTTLANPSSATATCIVPAHAALTSVLDLACHRIFAGEARVAATDLLELFDRLFREASPAEQALVIQTCREHRLHELLLEDPYTARAFQKPRGYAGDAVMLDYMYSGNPPLGTSPIGAAIFAVTAGCAAAQSVVARRDLLRALIDRAAERSARPNILAVACGHLREAAASVAVREGRASGIIALDQDAESLAVVERVHARDGVRTLRESVGGLLKGRVTFADLDLAYAAGLYDYLDDRTAAALTGKLFAMLRPGGSLVVANFTPGHQARGYMTTFMDWRLICRDEAALDALALALPPAAVAGKRTFTDSAGNIAYLELVRGSH